MRRTNKLLRSLKGWEFDIKALRASESMKEGRFSIPSKMPRANSTNHPNNPTILKEDEWCHYGGLPSPKAYMD